MQEQKRIKSLTRKFGWSAILNDGTKASETGGFGWSNVKDKVISLCIVDDMDNIIVALPNGQPSYVQGKTGSCNVSGGSVTIENRWVGFKTKSGETIVANVSDKTGTVTIGVLR